MHFQRINRTNVEKGFGVFENRSGGTISGNFPVCFTTTAASADGYQAVSPASGQLATFAGIADADVADAGVGLMQTYGFRDSVRVFATGTSGTNAVGIALGPGPGSNGVNSTGLKDNYAPVIAMESTPAAVNSPGGYIKAFIRLL